MRYSVALDGSLYQAFHEFKHGRSADSLLLERLLHVYKPPHITNIAQLRRLGIDNAALQKQLAATRLVDQDVDELAAMTRFKVLLTAADIETTTRPTDGAGSLRVNIFSDQLENNYTLTCKPGQPRTQALHHLRNLLRDARTVLVCDMYFNQNWQWTRQLFDLFPKRPLSLFLAHRLEQERISELKACCELWKIRTDTRKTYHNHHDRYLRINDQMEIVLTSGIAYLFNESRECTMIWRWIGA